MSSAPASRASVSATTRTCARSSPDGRVDSAVLIEAFTDSSSRAEAPSGIQARAPRRARAGSPIPTRELFADRVLHRLPAALVQPFDVRVLDQDREHERLAGARLHHAR